MRQIGLENYFDAVSDGNNITKSKPDPEVFLKAAEMLGVKPDSCIVVEDADSGVTAGKNAGTFTFSVNGAKGADIAINSLDDAKIVDIISGQ